MFLTGRCIGVIILTHGKASHLDDRIMTREQKPDSKERALKEMGLLNPHPGSVKDEHFETSEFFDARDLVQVKYEMLRRVHREGDTVSWAAERFGLSRPTFYEARRAVEEEGLGGLLPKRPGPKGPQKLTEDVMRVVGERRSKVPGVSSEELVAYVEERFGIRVHRRSIERALARREKKRPRPR